ncbi:MAG TPA: sulfur carrier protein ThiS [Acidimicrobiales bacterium]|nr:sulfur carrier protein ThiS [Acidimicrobiales bacterium]
MSAPAQGGGAPRGPTDAPEGTARTTVSVAVNGSTVVLPAGTTVRDLVERYWGAAGGVAVAVDGQIVSRSEWAAREVADGAAVEIVTAAAGG